MGVAEVFTSVWPPSHIEVPSEVSSLLAEQPVKSPTSSVTPPAARVFLYGSMPGLPTVTNGPSVTSTLSRRSPLQSDEEGFASTVDNHWADSVTMEIEGSDATEGQHESEVFANEEVGDTDSTAHSHSSTREKLGVIPLAVMVFYGVSGGPFGVESSVRSGGNFFTLLGFLVMPFVWSLPEAMITAELGAALPEASGGVAWVEEAFGSYAGWMAGYLGWVAGATDNAIYPVLFMEYVLQVINADGDVISPVLRFFMLSGTSILLAYVNWLGLDVVGHMSVTICIVAMSPFVILSIVGAFKVDPARWFIMPSKDLDAVEAVTDDDLGGGFFPNFTWDMVLWRPFLNNLFWNLNSFDAGASFAGDVDNPARVLPRAMILAVVMVIVGYFVPLLVALGASTAKQTEWVDGYLAVVATQVVGKWLGGWFIFAAGISNIAQFQAELSADAFQLMGMADRGYVPKIFSTRSQYGTPTYGILLGTAIIVVMGVSHLDQLIEMLNFNYAIALLLEYSAFIKLRISRPDMHRPWKVPLNNFMCIICLIPTYVFILIVLGLATFNTYIFALAVNVLGMIVYKAMKGNMDKVAALCTSRCRRGKKYSPVNGGTAVPDSPTLSNVDDDNDSDVTFA